MLRAPQPGAVVRRGVKAHESARHGECITEIGSGGIFFIVPESTALERAVVDRPMRRALRVSQAGSVSTGLAQYRQRGNRPSVFARVNVPVHAWYAQAPPRCAVQLE